MKFLGFRFIPQTFGGRPPYCLHKTEKTFDYPTRLQCWTGKNFWNVEIWTLDIQITNKYLNIKISHFWFTGVIGVTLQMYPKLGKFSIKMTALTSVFKKYFKVILGHDFLNKVEKGQIFIFFKKGKIQYHMKN